MSSFLYTFGEPTNENLAKALDSIIQAIEKNGGSVGELDSVLGNPSEMEAGGIAEEAITPLGFEVSADTTTITVAPGTIHSDDHAQETLSSPANGTWYVEVKVVINATTGAITSTDILISSSESANTSTDFFGTIAEIDVTGGDVDPSTLVQYNYGPMLAIPYGSATDTWEVAIF